MKRFTETEKWGKTWFQELEPRLKCLWVYLCENCDRVGVWDANFRLASFQIGVPVAEKDLDALGNRLVRLGEDKLFIKNFIGFQYGELSTGCPAHKPVFRLMEKYHLEGLIDWAQSGYGRYLEKFSNRVSSNLSNRVSDTLKEKDKEKDKEKEEDKKGCGEESEGSSKAKFKAAAEEIYQSYPRKIAKANALKAIAKVLASGREADWLLERVEAYAAAVAAQDPKFIPHPATWFNGGRFDDDPAEWGVSSQKNEPSAVGEALRLKEKRGAVDELFVEC